MRIGVLALLLCLPLMASGCSSKPAYSEMNVNRSRPATAEAEPAENESGKGTASTSDQPAGADSATGQAQGAQPAQTQPPVPSPNSEVKIPWFVDTRKQQVKDLPNYPNSRVRNVSYGPIQGSDTMSLGLETRDPMNKIADFYAKAIKTNKWTVADTTQDPELTEWILKKGDNGEAKVQIKKDPRSDAFLIVIVRVERPKTSAK